jgi:hypothetical protein
MKQTDILIKIAGGECVGVGCDRCGKTIATSLDTSIHDILDMCDQEPHLCENCRAIEEGEKDKQIVTRLLRDMADFLEDDENDE